MYDDNLVDNSMEYEVCEKLLKQLLIERMAIINTHFK